MKEGCFVEPFFVPIDEGLQNGTSIFVVWQRSRLVGVRN